MSSVQRLLYNGADINAPDGHSRAVLQKAAMINGNVEEVRLLLNRGADLHGSRLQHAVWSNDKNILPTLLDYGAQVSTKPPGLDSNAMHDAAEFGRTDIVELLLRARANVTAYGGMNGYPLEAAAQYLRRLLLAVQVRVKPTALS